MELNTREARLEFLQGFWAEWNSVKPETITEETNIMDDLGADSVDIIEYVMAIEETFDISIPDEEMELVKTIKGSLDLIEKVIKEEVYKISPEDLKAAAKRRVKEILKNRERKSTYLGYKVSRGFRTLTIYEFDKKTGQIEGTMWTKPDPKRTRAEKKRIIEEELTKYGLVLDMK